MSIVYMTKEITPESLVRIYHALGISFTRQRCGEDLHR